jgi:hypothetical protein
MEDHVMNKYKVLVWDGQSWEYKTIEADRFFFDTSNSVTFVNGGKAVLVAKEDYWGSVEVV